MALNTKRFFKCDPTVWVKAPAAPGLSAMPAHQAKEGALLMLEAGAPRYPALLRLASQNSAFTMQEAFDLVEARSVAAEAKVKREIVQKRVQSGTLKFIEPVSPSRKAEEQKQRISMQLRRYPIKIATSVPGRVLIAMLMNAGRISTSRENLERLFPGTGDGRIVNVLKQLSGHALVARITVGRKGDASIWELTELGADNAKLLAGVIDAEEV